MAKKILVILKEVAIGLCVTAVAVASAVGLGLLVKHKNSGQNSCIRRNSGDQGPMIGNASLSKVESPVSRPLFAEEIDMTGGKNPRYATEIKDEFLKKCIDCSPGWQGNTNICGFAALSFIANMEGRKPPIKGVATMEGWALKGLDLVGRLENETKRDKRKPVAERVANAIQNGIDCIEIQRFLTDLFEIRNDVYNAAGEIYAKKVEYLQKRNKLLEELEKLPGGESRKKKEREYHNWRERIANEYYSNLCAKLEDNYVIMLRGAHFTVVAGTFVDEDGQTKIIHYQPMDTCTASRILIRNEDEFKKTYFDIGNQIVDQMMYVKKTNNQSKEETDDNLVVSNQV